MMLERNLIKNCTCGNSTNFKLAKKSDINILICEDCGVSHQELVGWDDQRYYDFYKSDYHTFFQKKKGIITYEERYNHDCKVATIRLTEYTGLLDSTGQGLDIGSSNSAFVHESKKLGFDCIGLEPGENIGDDSVTIRGTLDTVEFSPEQFSWITMHDSIEHIVDIVSSLKRLFSILKPNGVLILDLPDYFIEAGRHHWKHIEHLWFFTEEQLTNLLKQYGFNIIEIKKPIPGKLVFYTRK